MAEFGFASSAGGDDELGVWQGLPDASERGLDSVAREVAQASEKVSLWQVALPGERRAADEALAAVGQRLVAADAALPLASRRLDVFAAAGAPAAELPPLAAGPEWALQGWIAASERGRLPEEAGRLDEVLAFYEKVRDTLRSFAVVDTEIGGARAGVTVVSWTGDFETAWARGLAADDAQHHIAAVAVALRTRDAWLRLGMTVAAGAAQLTALAGLNPALALPAAYRFVRSIIRQVQAFEEQTALA